LAGGWVSMLSDDQVNGDQYGAALQHLLTADRLISSHVDEDGIFPRCIDGSLWSQVRTYPTSSFVALF
jgi:hypothetical protein